MKKLLAKLFSPLHRSLRKYYENRVSLPYGIAQFLASLAFAQLKDGEYLTLNSPSGYLGDIHVTASGARPVLTYKFWKKRADWKDEIPYVQAITELRGFNVHQETNESVLARTKAASWNIGNPGDQKPIPEPKFNDSDWQLVQISDDRVNKLKDLFLGFAFYNPVRVEHKKKLGANA